MRHNMHMGDFAGGVSPLISLILMILGLAILYFIIRLAVRHGIESSEVAKILREQKDKSDQLDHDS